MKKILALIVALALVFSVCAISVFADDDEGVAVYDEPTVISTATGAETTAEETTAEETTAEETTAEETTAEETTGAEDVVIGDVNGDGVLDIIDVALTRAYIVGNETPDYDFDTLADVNFDGVVDIIDVVIMRSAIVNNTPIEAPVSDDTDTETDAETTGEETTGEETTGDETSETETTVEEDSETEDEYDSDTFFTGEAAATWDPDGVTVYDGSVESYEGDELVIEFTVTGENPQLKFIAKVGDEWTWTEIGTTLYEDDCIKLTGDTLIIALNDDEVAALNNAKVLLIQGQDVTVTSVALRWVVI